jgi:hypothetical protein
MNPQALTTVDRCYRDSVPGNAPSLARVAGRRHARLPAPARALAILTLPLPLCLIIRGISQVSA